MAKGRKQLPISVKETKGTLRKSRIRTDMPAPSGKRTICRGVLSASAKKAFKTLHAIVADMGNSSATYSHALSMAAMLWADMEELATDIAKEGWTVESETAHGAIIVNANPKVRMLRDTQRELRTMLIEFGLTPASIQKVGTVKKKTENVFKEFADV
jgi:P27 family predicted phage terminase small subunit